MVAKVVANVLLVLSVSMVKLHALNAPLANTETRLQTVNANPVLQVCTLLPLVPLRALCVSNVRKVDIRRR